MARRPRKKKGSYQTSVSAVNPCLLSIRFIQFANMRLLISIVRQWRWILPRDRQITLRYLIARRKSPQSPEWYSTIPLVKPQSYDTLQFALLVENFASC